MHIFENYSAVVSVLGLILPSLHSQGSLLVQIFCSIQWLPTGKRWKCRNASETVARGKLNWGCRLRAVKLQAPRHSRLFLTLIWITTVTFSQEDSTWYSAACVCSLYFIWNRNSYSSFQFFKYFNFPSIYGTILLLRANECDCKSCSCIFMTSEDPRNVFWMMNKWSTASLINKLHRSNRGSLSPPTKINVKTTWQNKQPVIRMLFPFTSKNEPSFPEEYQTWMHKTS